MFRIFLSVIFLFTPLLHADVQFKTGTLSIGKAKLSIEIAETDEQHAYGLMHRTSMRPDHGMLFVFTDEEPRNFWTKNTFIPLSIGYFAADKTLVDMQDMTPLKSLMDQNITTYPSAKPAKYALEVNQGWFKKHRIKLKDKFTYTRH